jgi:hypothetical protein
MSRLTEEMESVFHDGGNRDPLSKLALRHLTGDHEVVMLWHPLGFIDIPLVRDDRIKMVIHVWHPNFSRRQEPPQICHSHGWHLISTVLTGAFENWSFGIDANANGRHQVYQISYDRAASISTVTDHIVDAERTARERLVEGQTYRIPSDSYHWSHSGDNIVVTAMYADLTNATPGRAIWKRSHAIEYRYVRQQCERSAASAIRRDVIAALKRSYSSRPI